MFEKLFVGNNFREKVKGRIRAAVLISRMFLKVVPVQKTRAEADQRSII
jgi:hypothetical protein